MDQNSGRGWWEQEVGECYDDEIDFSEFEDEDDLDDDMSEVMKEIFDEE